tara:strand:+ start:17113 stop:17445 length:333 start_codon:yes stop_codon:yes gene_type:complete
VSNQNQKIKSLLEELLVVLSEEETEVPSVPAKKKAPKISSADRKKLNKARQKNFSEVLGKAKASKQDQKKCLTFLQKAMEIASDAGNAKPRVWHSHVATVEKCHRAWIKA